MKVLARSYERRVEQDGDEVALLRLQDSGTEYGIPNYCWRVVGWVLIPEANWQAWVR